MNKITMIALALVALMAATEAQFGEMGRVSNRFSSRDGIRDFDRSRFGFDRSHGLRGGNRLGARRGSGSRIGYGNRLAGERYNNFKEFNDFAAEDDFRANNNLRVAIEQNDNVASHQAVKQSNGIQHSDGEKIAVDERVDAQHYDNSQFDRDDHFQKFDNTRLDAAEEDTFWGQRSFDRGHENDFRGFGGRGFGWNKW